MGIIFMSFISSVALAQPTTVFSSDFTASAGSAYTTVTGPIGNNATWSMIRSGNDFGARINSGILSLTNNASGAANINGWILAYTTGQSAPYNPVLNQNAGVVTWTFNMRQNRSNPSGITNGYYANAFVLAGTGNTTGITGSGYAVVLGQSGKTDRLRLVRYTAGLRTSTDLLASNTSGLSDFGNQYLSVKVTYTPSTNTWQLFVRNDGGNFVDPSIGTLTSQGTVVNSASTGTALPLLGAFWNAGTKNNQTAFFDNIKVTVDTPYITSISPTSKIAGTNGFTLTVNGVNFISSSTIRWNGVNRPTTFVSPTQLTAVIPATDITTPGSVPISVGTGSAVSNSIPFIIDAPNVPSVSTSISALNAFSTITGTASASQSFTATGSNLTENITVTAPSNFEVSISAAGTYTPSISIASGTTTIFVRVRAAAPPGIYSGAITLSTAGAASKQVDVSAKVLSTEPTNSDTGPLVFSNTTSIATTITWTNGNGANHLVVVRALSGVNATPTDGVSYSASQNFGSGSELGTGNYVVYNSTGNSVTVTGLTPATQYYVSVFGFNGGSGTENYKITTPATGNRTTLNAPVGLQIMASNAVNAITFDNSVEGVNNGVFSAGSISTLPDTGELNSNSWSFAGFSSGNIAFGGESPDESVYEGGQSEGGVDDGGVYAFEVAPENFALGFQPGTGDFLPGSVTLRFQNQTGSAINSVSVGYKVYVYNDEAGSNSLNFSYSADNNTYTTVAALNHVTPAAADAAPGWKAYYKVVTIPVAVAANNYGYIRWTGAAVSGTAYDEIAIDDIVVVTNPTTQFATFSGNAETFVLAGNANLSGTTTIAENIEFNNGKVIIGANTLTINGSVTNTVLQGIRGSDSSNLIVGGNVNKTLSFDQTSATTRTFNSFSVATTSSNTTTINNNVIVNGTLSVASDQTFNLGTNTLMGTLTTVINNGVITTQNTTATPVTTGRVWGGTGTFNLNAASTSQTLVVGTYNNVTVSTTGGATMIGNVTVNGTLHLPNANPSSTLGALATSTNTLFMGPQATNTGIGDVSGIITRNTGITSNVLYTFGHPNTSIIIPPVGTLPSSMSIRVVLGSAPAGKSDAILRTYDFIQTGGSGNKAIITAHYLDSELNGNVENKLVDWVINYSPLTLFEQSRSNYSTTENWVELGNVNLSFFSSVFGAKALTLANSQLVSSVWNGSQSSSWTTAENWTPTGTPSDLTSVIIPDAETTPNDPILNQNVTIGALTLEPGAILNDWPTGSNLIITGSTGAWLNNGTFNAGASTVTFNTLTVEGVVYDATIAGSTTFNNITVASGSTLRALTDNYMAIGGTFTKTGSFVTGAVHSAVAYTGTNQTVVTPNGAGLAYHDLILSGTGTIIPTSLNVRGDLTLNQSVNFAGTTVSLIGVNDEYQYIKGTVSPQFNNLVVNKPSGDVILQSDVTVGGQLTLTQGLMILGEKNLILGTAPVAGSFSETAMIVADGTGVVRRPYTQTGSYLFPIGEMTGDTRYSPITVNITSGTFNNAFVDVNVRDAVHPDNYSVGSKLSRYWNVQQTGISNAVATITATYQPNDVEGSGDLAAAQLNGTFDIVTNPWTKFSNLTGTTLLAENALLTSGQRAAFTGITAENPLIVVTGGGTFCENEVVTLTTEVSGGVAPYTYTWSNGLGNAPTATPDTSIIGTTTYTVTVRDLNGIASVATADVIVTEGPDAGTLTGNQTICEGFADPITLNGYAGNIIRWERSINPAFTNPTFINSSAATLSSEEMGNLNSSRYFRAVVQSGSCLEVYSNAVLVTVSSTTWSNGAWSNNAPVAGVAAIFTSDYTADANIEACSIQVTNNANVVIPSGLDVILTGRITVTSGSFTLENNAHLIQLTDVENVGAIIVKKNGSSLFKLDYTSWSSPVTGQNLNAFSPATLPNRFYTYGVNANNVEAFLYVDSYANTFIPGKGYHIRMPNEITGPNAADYNNGQHSFSFEGIFRGVPHNGTITTPLNTSGNRFSLVGNPYPSPINVHAFYDGNEGIIDQASALYFWRKRNNSEATSYATLTKDAYTYNQAEGGGQEWDDFFNESDESEWVINVGQGFFVKADAGAVNPQLQFTNSMRRADAHNNQFFRNGQDNEEMKSRYWLNLTGSDKFSQIAVVYSNTATLGIDYGRDGNAMASGPLALYSIIDDHKLAIQARPAFAASDIVSLGYKAETAGTYTITLHRFDGLFGQGQDIYLKDKSTGLYHDIKAAPYEFVTGEGVFTDRFEVVYTTSALNTKVPHIDPNHVIVYKKDKVLSIATGSAIMSEVEIFDVRGRLLYNAKDLNTNEFSTDALQAEQQVLIVNITTDRGKVSKKVIY